ncbi:unnamed protein product [Moneuplotes crassus]|uniref:Uncharacterized protein n=1 Tax=Euplotes crassus TaxID=5936 RepID=A0AAD1XVI5_EUPCR|nr:unnamed protein product [Moneuplotes crassus]
MSIKHRVSLKDRLDSTKDRKERTNSKISPILQRKNTKNSGNSTMGTMQIETKGLSSPYLKQFVSNNLGQLKNFPGAGEVEYKYMANEDGSQSNHSESKQERLTGKMSRMQKSASVSLRTTNKHSSFQDNNLLIPSSIEEDDMEDTLRSASPNIFENNGHSKLAEWRTQKNISLDEYNEFSEHCNDYDQVEAIEDYVESLNRAMSENNVKPIASRKRSNYRKFYHSNFDEELSVSSGEESFDFGYDDCEAITRQISQRYTLNSQNDRISAIRRECKRNEESHRNTGLKKAVTKRSENSNTNKVSSIATSHVDIDTVDGKTVIKRVTKEEKEAIVKNRLKNFLL